MLNFDPSKLAESGNSKRFSAVQGSAYDAIVAKGRRKAPIARSRSEDAELTNSERPILIGGTRDLRRNFAGAAFGIRKHLDYVSTFSFQCRCSHNRALLRRYSKEVLQALDDMVESIIRSWSRREYFDAGGRHGLPRMIRMIEALRTVDGDALSIMRRDKKVQLVEGDRIRNPIGATATAAGIAPEDFLNIINGVLIDPATGAAQGYCVHKRDRTGQTLTFDRLVPARFASLHGYFDRYDQVRGISPMAAAVNQFRDLYESFDYTLAKEKVAQMFALAIYREGVEELDNTLNDEQTDDSGDTDGDGDGDDDGQDYSQIQLGRGPLVLDLDPGDKAEFLNAQGVTSNSQAFWQLVLMIALKSLDIPLCFFDENYASWPGLRQAWVQYDMSAKTKQRDNRELLDSWTARRLVFAILDDELVLPDGMMVTDIAWEWIAGGVPWLDQLKEVTANIAAVGAGLADPQDLLKSQNKDPFEVIDRIAEFQEYAASKNVKLSYLPPPTLAPDDPADNAGGGKKSAIDASDGSSGNSKKKKPAKKKSGGAAK